MTTFSEEPDEDEYMDENFTTPTILELVNDASSINCDIAEMEVCPDERYFSPVVAASSNFQEDVNNGTVLQTQFSLPQMKHEADQPEIPMHANIEISNVFMQPCAEPFKNDDTDHDVRDDKGSFHSISITRENQCSEEGSSEINETTTNPLAQESLQNLRIAATSIISTVTDKLRGDQILPSDHLTTKPDDQGFPIGAASLTQGVVTASTQLPFSCTFTEESDEDEEIRELSSTTLNQQAQLVAAQKVQDLLQLFDSQGKDNQVFTTPIPPAIPKPQLAFAPPIITIEDDQVFHNPSTITIPTMGNSNTEIKLTFTDGDPTLFKAPWMPPRFFDDLKFMMVHPFITPFGRHIWPGVRIPLALMAMVEVPRIPKKVLSVMEADDLHDSDFDDDMCRDTFAARRQRKSRKLDSDTVISSREAGNSTNRKRRKGEDDTFVRSCTEEDRKEILQLEAKRGRIRTPPLPLPQTRANNVGADDYNEADAYIEDEERPSTPPKAVGVIDIIPADYELPLSFSDKYSQHGVEPCGRRLDTWPKREVRTFSSGKPGDVSLRGGATLASKGLPGARDRDPSYERDANSPLNRRGIGMRRAMTGRSFPRGRHGRLGANNIYYEPPMRQRNDHYYEEDAYRQQRDLERPNQRNRKPHWSGSIRVTESPPHEFNADSYYGRGVSPTRQMQNRAYRQSSPNDTVPSSWSHCDRDYNDRLLDRPPSQYDGYYETHYDRSNFPSHYMNTRDDKLVEKKYSPHHPYSEPSYNRVTIDSVHGAGQSTQNAPHAADEDWDTALQTLEASLEYYANNSG